MSDPQSKADLIEQLDHIQHAVSATLERQSAEQFFALTEDTWSAADYLKHLLLSVKPFAKALHRPPAQLQGMFGEPTSPSKTYAEFVTIYTQRIADGVKAEDYNAVTPAGFRLPEGIDDEKTYLTETWTTSNQSLLDALRTWDDADLDRAQLPHPAVGLITVREMLFFTLHHNTLHWRDIQRVGGM